MCYNNTNGEKYVSKRNYINQGSSTIVNFDTHFDQDFLISFYYRHET